MVLMTMSMILLLHGFYNGIANISLSLCTNIFSKQSTTTIAQ